VHKQARLDFDDLMLERGYAALKAYARSKLANILFANVLAQQLEGTGVTVNALHPGTGVTVNALHPGAVRTGLAGNDDVKGPLGRALMTIARPFMLSPERGAQTSIYLASSPEVEGKTGGYYDRSKLATTSTAAQDHAAAERLWQVSEALVAKARKA
jgi:NAD(P)-dependent dehydrogenase (short-subunit alcohol dehydrogenase family)